MSTEAVEMSNRARRYQEAAQLLRQWMERDGDYDEQVWSMLEESLKDNRVHCRELDEPSA